MRQAEVGSQGEGYRDRSAQGTRVAYAAVSGARSAGTRVHTNVCTRSYAHACTHVHTLVQDSRERTVQVRHPITENNLPNIC